MNELLLALGLCGMFAVWCICARFSFARRRRTIQKCTVIGDRKWWRKREDAAVSDTQPPLVSWRGPWDPHLGNHSHLNHTRVGRGHGEGEA